MATRRFSRDDFKRIAAEIPDSADQYEYVGIRIQTGKHGAKVGKPINHRSSNWDDGVELDSYLDGVSAIDTNSVHLVDRYGGYHGDTALILGSYYAEYGDDPGELVMRDAVVLAIK